MKAQKFLLVLAFVLAVVFITLSTLDFIHWALWLPPLIASLGMIFSCLIRLAENEERNEQADSTD